MIKHLFLIVAMALNVSYEPSVSWTSEVRDLGSREYELVLSGEVGEEYYTHPMDDEWSGTTLEINPVSGLELLGAPVEEYEPSDYKGTKVVRGRYVIKQRFKASEAVTGISSGSWALMRRQFLCPGIPSALWECSRRECYTAATLSRQCGESPI
jgi:hypothetical protein